MFESAEMRSPRGCSTDELIELMAAHNRAESAQAQRKLAVVAELYRRRKAEDARAQLCTSQQGEFVTAEVAVALTVSTGVAAGFLHVGLDLDDRLPATRRAFARGELDFTRVRLIVERTANVDDAVIATVEERILDAALTPGRELTRTRLASAIDRIVMALDPAAARERRVRAEADRDVQVRPDADGMSSLWGALPAVAGRAVDTKLREMAIGVCGSDPRTMAQRRADALAALALGADHLACTCVDPGCPVPTSQRVPATPRVLIQVMVDAATLLGATDVPGVLAGYGSVDPELVRSLAADATWQRLLTDATGTVSGVGPTLRAGRVPAAGALRYAPGAALARLVRARDGQCRFPSCGVPAASCDLDHVRAFDHLDPTRGGPTLAENLQCLCRWHHRMKTCGAWQVRGLTSAVMQWTSPTGAIHETVPQGGIVVSDLDPNAAVADTAATLHRRPRRMQRRRMDRHRRMNHRGTSSACNS